MVSKADIQKASKLAAIDLGEEAVDKLTGDLQNIMHKIEEMKKVDCSDIDPLISVCDHEIYLREDEVTESDLGAALFSNVPGKDAAFAKEIKCFIVPKVVE